MAIFTPGPVIGEIRGSSGGTTFSRNRFGPYIRNRSVPVNPQTAPQTLIRSLFAAIASVWTVGLTQVQRNAWNLYGDNIPWLNALGEPINLTGFNHFIRANVVNLQTLGLITLDGPTDFTLPGADPAFAPTVSEATQLITVAFDNTLPWANQDNGVLSILMSKPLSAGNSVGSKFLKFAGSIRGDLAVPPVSPLTIAVPFAVAEGQIVRVGARILEDDGRMSSIFQQTVFALA